MSPVVQKAMGVAAIAVLAVIADQASKAAALAYLSQPPGRLDVAPFLSFRLGFNTGISFGLFKSTFAAQPWLLITVQTVVVLAMLGLAARSQSRSESAALSLIAGGAIGNIIDRAPDGAVTDFLDLHWQGWHWPTFNIADVAICIGAALLLASAFLPSKNVASVSAQTQEGSMR